MRKLSEETCRLWHFLWFRRRDIVVKQKQQSPRTQKDHKCNVSLWFNMWSQTETLQSVQSPHVWTTQSVSPKLWVWESNNLDENEQHGQLFICIFAFPRKSLHIRKFLWQRNWCNLMTNEKMRAIYEGCRKNVLSHKDTHSQVTAALLVYVLFSFTMRKRDFSSKFQQKWQTEESLWWSSRVCVLPSSS